MKAAIGNHTRIIKHDGKPEGTGTIISFDVDKMQFLIEWSSPEEKKGQQENIAYCWLLDVTRD